MIKNLVVGLVILIVVVAIFLGVPAVGGYVLHSVFPEVVLSVEVGVVAVVAICCIITFILWIAYQIGFGVSSDSPPKSEY